MPKCAAYIQTKTANRGQKDRADHITDWSVRIISQNVNNPVLLRWTSQLLWANGGKFHQNYSDMMTMLIHNHKSLNCY